MRHGLATYCVERYGASKSVPEEWHLFVSRPMELAKGFILGCFLSSRGALRYRMSQCRWIPTPTHGTRCSRP